MIELDIPVRRKPSDTASADLFACLTPFVAPNQQRRSIEGKLRKHEPIESLTFSAHVSWFRPADVSEIKSK